MANRKTGGMKQGVGPWAGGNNPDKLATKKQRREGHTKKTRKGGRKGK